MGIEFRPQFYSFLKQQGLKLTPKREKVLQEAFVAGGHFEAEHLVRRLRERGGTASRATVYRTLPLLVRAGLLKEVIHGEKQHHYEPIRGEERHDHLICIQCGTILEFENGSLREIEKEICKQHEFRPKKILIEIFGYCRGCR